MANLPETPQWEEGVYQIEVSDPVLGGPDGISNRQAKQLASRTSYLKQQVEKGDKGLADHIAAPDPHTQYAPKKSPALTGTPTAPTAVKTDNSTKLATTGHVKAVVADYAPLASPGLTGKPTAPTAAQTANDTQLATTAFVKAALAALVASSPEALDTLNELAAALGNDPNFATTMTNALAGKQPLDNTLTSLSGKDVAGLLSYLGLKEAAQRDVGTGINQIPDMSAWDSGSNWRRTPDGFIEVWGYSSVANTSTGIAVATFPVPFPNECLSVMINEVTNVASGVSGVKSWGLARDTMSKTGVSAILNVTGSPAAGEFFVYRAIGR